ncbi:tRNA pseudouridine(38-40) synthase TruA [Peptococcus simiae]|uniref:tRNA pseudouridine(38-40) synthase TruA n=1 Tax=Peptococcus simiae TaxID=1643805 RepID=UPI0039800C62
MARFKVTIAYDGSGFHGFQRQAGKDLRTVQGVLEDRLTKLLDAPIIVHAAGRTDAGVHAKGQVFHFDTARNISAEGLIYAFNRYLPADITANEVVQAAPGFHARKLACGKCYGYHLYTGRRLPAIGHMYLAHEIRPVDEAVFSKVLAQAEGTHYFAGFCGRGASTLTYDRTLYRVRVFRAGDYWAIYLIGDGFLRKMVRNLVGTALDEAAGRKPAGTFARALASGKREEGGNTAPAEGLFLERVYYDQENLARGLDRLDAGRPEDLVGPRAIFTDLF